MGYIDKSLINSEQVLYKTTLHWIVFGWPLFWTFAILAFTIKNPPIQLSQIIPVLGSLFSIYLWLVAAIQYLTSEFGITNQRVIMKMGWIRIYSFEILLPQIESIQVNQSIPGRILNYGTITIIGKGGSKDPFAYIHFPLRFRKKVQEQIERFHRQ